MIAADSKIDGVEARALKPGDYVMSWDGRQSGRWFKNEIVKVRQGQARSIYSVICLDGVAPMRLRCDGQQEFALGPNRPKAKSLTSGSVLRVSEGAHVFKAVVGAVDLEMGDPEMTIGFELKRHPVNFLAEGFLCQA